MITRLAGAVCAAFLVTSCGDIESQSSSSTSAMKVGGEHVAGLGDAVLTVQNSESLPNAFGGADIFGRERPTGTTTVYYNGFRNGKAQFVRRDVLIQSSKTTMNSTPIVVNPSSQSYYSGNVGGIPYSGTSSTTAYPLVIPPNTPQDRVVGVRDVNLSVGIGEPVVVSGRTFTVVSATPNQVKFTLQ